MQTRVYTRTPSDEMLLILPPDPPFREVYEEFTIIVFPVSKNQPAAILLVYS